MGSYTFLPHTADEKFVVTADTLEDGFATCVLAFYEIMMGKQVVKKNKSVSLSITAKHKRSLLYDFLNELVYYLDAEGLLLQHVESLSISQDDDGFTLQATLTGDYLNKYDLGTAIKNMTYSDMVIEENPVKIVVVVDI